MKLLENIEKLIIIALLICVVVVAAYYRIQTDKYEKEINGLNVRLAQAEEKADTFFIHDSIPVIQQKIVEVDKTDYKKLLADKELINDLKLKVKEIEAENRFLMSTRDTVVLKPSYNDSILTYSDHWNRFSFELKSRVLDWEVRDSLVTFVSAEYKHHFLWWRWGLKGYKVTNVNFNPKSRIEYNKYIKIK